MGQRTIPATTNSSVGTQNTPLATQKPLPGTGLFGSSSVGHSFSNAGTGPKTSSASKIDSLFSFLNISTGAGNKASSTLFTGQPSTLFATNATAPSPAAQNSNPQSGGLFGGVTATSSASGSMAPPTKSGFSGFGAATTPSSSTTQPSFGGTFGVQAKPSWPASKEMNAPTGGPFAHSEPSSSSKSDLSTPKLFRTTANPPPPQIPEPSLKAAKNDTN